MNKIIWIVVIVLTLVVGYVAAGPFLTIYAIKTGVVENDSEKLSENIEFPLLRQNMKEQLNAVMMKNAATEMEDNPFAALEAGLVAKMIDGIVDSFVTPSGLAALIEVEGNLAALIEGKEPNKDENGGNTPPLQKDDLFKKARFSYDSMSKFSIWVPNDKGEEVRFVLNREGFSWKLVNLVIPNPMDENP